MTEELKIVMEMLSQMTENAIYGVILYFLYDIVGQLIFYGTCIFIVIFIGRTIQSMMGIETITIYKIGASRLSYEGERTLVSLVDKALQKSKTVGIINREKEFFAYLRKFNSEENTQEKN